MEITQQSPSKVLSLPEAEWRAREAAHQDRLTPFLEAHLARKHKGVPHPVHDFLFEYYNYRPAQLLRWSPGIQVYLEGSAEEFLTRRYFRDGPQGVGLYPDSLPESRRSAAQWIVQLLEATAHRAPFFGCMGMHEWAMVYNERDIRHASLPLRMPHTELVAFVGSTHICCSHFDAFRFFSKEAVPMNSLQPRGNTREQFEQPGCLHANMDLYKWAHKLSPWIDSELIADAFWLAVEARELDMRASPYDVRELGYEAIEIETEAGRKIYTECQEAVWKKGQVVREGLIRSIHQVLEGVSPSLKGD